VSYRRSDNQDATGRIYDRLTAHFGKENIFKDVDSIPLGVDFRKHLSDVVGQCQLFLAVLGAKWLDVQDEAGKRRLDSPNDVVRIEIEAALARGIPVIPVLVGNARMPSEADLPPSLSPLAFRQGIDVRPDPDFHHDMDRLGSALQTLLRSTPIVGSEKVSIGTEPRDATPKDIKDDLSHIASSVEPANLTMEATPGELQMVREMVARLTTNGLNQEVSQLAPVARDLHRSGQGREVLSLCQIIGDAKLSEVDRYKAVKLMGLAIRQQHAKPYVEKALDTLLDYGVLSSPLQTASIEAIMMSPASPKAKWERLFAALDLANEGQLYAIIMALSQVIPPSERQVTGARLVEMIETTNSAVHPICTVLKQIGYRAGVPALIRITEFCTPWKAAPISDVLVSWRVIEAVPAIRQVVENARYGTDHNVAQLAKYLYALEGVVASGYLAEVLRDAAPEMQGYLIGQLGDVHDSVFVEVVSDLARNSLDEPVKRKAQDFMQKNGQVI
jgi:hypothetical protein